MPTTRRRQDEVTISLMLDQNEEGLSALLRNHGAKVKACLAKDYLGILSDIEIDAAIMQALSEVFQSPEKFNPNLGSLDTFFLVVADRRARDTLRQRIRRESLHELRPPSHLINCDSGEAVAASVEADELATAIHELISDLPDLQRHVMEGDFANGTEVSAEALVRSFGRPTSAGAVYNARLLARKKIRKELLRRGIMHHNGEDQ